LAVKVIGNTEAIGQTYNLSDPGVTTIKVFMEKVCKELNLQPPAKVMPKVVALNVAAILETIYRLVKAKSAPAITRKKVTFVARSRSINSTKAYALLGDDQFSFEQGMKITLDHLKSLSASEDKVSPLTTSQPGATHG